MVSADLVPNAISANKSLSLLAQKEIKIRRARKNLKDFIEYMMPDPEHYDDVTKSNYECRPVHELIIGHFMKVVKRQSFRSALSIPSQHGKTTVAAEYGLAFYAANYPKDMILYGTYSEPRAGVVGENVRNIMESERFHEVFPEFSIRKGASSKVHIGFEAGGSIMFLGRNSGGSGNPCNLFVIDDPYKNDAEAKSSTVRDEVWNWYSGVVEARCPAQTPIFIVHTRWSDDDLIGRLCDSNHPEFDSENNDNFDYLNLPGIIYESEKELIDLLDIKLCSEEEAKRYMLPERAGTLWPQKYSKDRVTGKRELKDHWPLRLYMNMRRKNKRIFSAMVMGNPVPPDGSIFGQKMMNPYRRGELPAEIRKYGSSDHAVSTSSRNDKTCMGIAGLDKEGVLWVLPDLHWGRFGPDKQVDKMANLIRTHRPLIWFAEGDHIKKSLGPFLKKKLRKLRLFSTAFKELSKNANKEAKAQAIIGMFELGMVRLPADAPWYNDAVSQLLRFDGREGRPDDFVDFLINLGRGLDKMIDASRSYEEDDLDQPGDTGTTSWIKWAARKEALFTKRQRGAVGW